MKGITMPEVDRFPWLSFLDEKERAIVEEGFNASLYAILNPEIDIQLLQEIQDRKVELTDELFFQLLAESAAYLGTVAFQSKIVGWQEVCLFPENREKKELKLSRANLHKIGRVLARSGPGPGSPDRLDNDAIHNVFENKFRYLETFFEGKKEKPSSHLLLQAHPDWKPAFRNEKGYYPSFRSIREMAYRLTLFHLEKTQPSNKPSFRQLRKIIKDRSR